MRDEGFACVGDLAALFDASDETVRRDPG
ncbi:MAG: DeoR family transcriptional regulator [Acidimicrobiales bacterium]